MSEPTIEDWRKSREAAWAETAALAAENRRLREALERIAYEFTSDGWLANFALEALEPGDE